jgi:isopentenyl diphosphate isomerase/L-lactate dehydrogenase-like FMN-dependent dehydrogenase
MQHARREFLRFLAASPLLAQIRKPEDALTAMDFEELCHNALPPAHWGFLASGVDDDLTVKANISAFHRIGLKPRRLVDVSKTDLGIELFGQRWSSPFFLCPIGAQKAFHPEGELAVARAARARHTVQVLSTATSVSIEDVTKSLGRAPWFQLYIPAKWDETERLIRRVEATGCPALMWTIDLFGGRNTESLTRLMRTDHRDCVSCHPPGPPLVVAGLPPAKNMPMLDGLGKNVNPPDANWSWVEQLKKMTKMKLLLKGIDNAEDAHLAREHGADGIVVSNHGGRATETIRATIDCLPEVVDAGRGLPVLIDGGLRRGTDVYKALALGARAVGIGRPYIYGLAAFGQAGVERVVDILTAELDMTMRQCGTPAIPQIGHSSVFKVG